jgi:hypothetical protein
VIEAIRSFKEESPFSLEIETFQQQRAAAGSKVPIARAN